MSLLKPALLVSFVFVSLYIAPSDFPLYINNIVLGCSHKGATQQFFWSVHADSYIGKTCFTTTFFPEMFTFQGIYVCMCVCLYIYLYI